MAEADQRPSSPRPRLSRGVRLLALTSLLGSLAASPSLAESAASSMASSSATAAVQLLALPTWVTAPEPTAAPALPGAAPSPRQAESEDEEDPSDFFLRRQCVRCHNDADRTGGLTLESFRVSLATDQTELAEKVIRKLRAGMMPPPPMRRPDPDQVRAVVAALETTIDHAADETPYSGRRTFQRLNRAEYRRSIQDLLDLEIDVEALLPADTVSQGFDNVADVQTLSATLLESYLRAAAQVARVAVGEPTASAREASYQLPRTASQLEHVEGAPWGTRGGVAVEHTFPADGEYSFEILLHGTPTGQLFGAAAEDEVLEISVNGEPVVVVPIDPLLDESDPGGLTLKTERFRIEGGPQLLAAAFPRRFDGPVNDLIAPIDHTLADTQIGNAWGLTTLPHLRSLTVVGPYDSDGVSETPSRDRIFRCRPTSADDELPCVRRILEPIAAKAYRRPVTTDDLQALEGFYRQGVAEGGFESGVRTALQAVLASPHFLFRLERPPEQALPGETYELAELELASRLSYFLWGTGPDEQLIARAESGELGQPQNLVAEVERLLGDGKATALSERFGAQWLRLQDLDSIHPDALAYPQFDQTLAAAFRRETELFFQHLVQHDRPLTELLEADYTFVNERLARHYGIPNITGSEFRRIEIADERRRGLLGHGSILTQTSHANRTSPVLRGKWVLEVLLGSPPPPPPPDVPELEATDAVQGDRVLSVRERLEEHRSNPACRSCHRVIDPIGLALENFDVTGAWRINDEGSRVDATGKLYDGTPLEGPTQLRQALLQRTDVLATTFTESLLAYALGRRVDHRDMPVVRQIVASAADQDYRLQSFILGVVQSPSFRLSQAEADGENQAQAEREPPASRGAVPKALTGDQPTVPRAAEPAGRQRF